MSATSMPSAPSTPSRLTALARTTEPGTALRRFLALDAVVTAANGLAYLAVSGPLGRLLGVDAGLLAWLGGALLGYAGGVAALAARGRPPVRAVGVVVEVNAAWALVSLVALVAWLSPTVAGAVWIPAQALAVAGFAAVQYAALRLIRAGSGRQ